MTCSLPHHVLSHSLHSPSNQGSGNKGNKLSFIPKAAAGLLESSVFRELEGLSVFEMIFFCVGVEPAHSMSKIYSTEKRQKIGKA